MALQDQTIDIPLGGGVHQDFDHRLLPMGALAEVRNGVYEHTGAIVHRPGFGVLPSTTTKQDAFTGTLTSQAMPTPRRIDVHRDEVLAIANDATTTQPTLHSLYKSGTQWVQKSRIPPCSVQRYVGPRPAYDCTKTSSVFLHVSNGYLVYVYVCNGTTGDVGIMMRVVDKSTGAVVVNDFVVAATYKAQVASACAGGVVHIVYGDNNGLYSYRYDLSTLAPLSYLTLDATAAGGSSWVADCVAYGSYLFVVYCNAAIGVNVTAKMIAVDGSTFATYASAYRATWVSCAAETGQANCYISYYYTTDSTVRVSGFTDSSLTQLYLHAQAFASLAGAVSAQCVAVDSLGRALVILDGLVYKSIAHGDPNDERCLVFQRMTTAGVADLTAQVAYHATLVSRPNQKNGKLYVVLRVGEYDGTDLRFSGPHILSLLDGDVDNGASWQLAGVLTRSAFAMPGIPLATSWALPHLPLDGTGMWCALPVLSVIVPTVTSVSVASGAADAAFLDFSERTTAGLWGTSKANDTLGVAGSYLAAYDSESVHEQSFVHYPRIIVTASDPATLPTGGGLTGSSTYYYRAYYEHVDAQGNLSYSEACPATRVDTPFAASPTCSVYLKLWCCSFTQRTDAGDGVARPVVIRIVRTQAGGTGNYYHVTSRTMPPMPSPVTNGAAPLSSKSTFYTQFTDTLSDAALTMGTAYFAGGVLESNCPVASRHVISHGRRLWSISSENPRRVYFTRTYQQGEAPAWNDILYVEIPDSPDGATALGYVDDNLLIFTPTRIYAVSGEGPNDVGVNEFAPPRVITTDIGCTDPRSIAQYDAGCVFYAQGAGFFNVTRGLSVEYIGAPVQDDAETTYDRVASMTVDARRSRIVATMADSAGSVSGKWLVYDYLHKAWTTWTPTTTTLRSTAIDSTGKLHYNDDNGIRKEALGAAPGIDPDNDGTFPGLLVTTPWVHLQSIGGYQRCREAIITLYRRSPCRVRVLCYFNYDNSASVEGHILDMQSGSTVEGLPYVRFVVRITNQKCSAIKLSVIDEVTTASDYLVTQIPEYIATEGGDHFVVNSGAAATVTQNPAGIDIAGISLRIGVKSQTAKLPAVNRST